VFTNQPLAPILSENKCRGCAIKNEFWESEDVSDVEKIHIHACMHKYFEYMLDFTLDV
jgi:hypothetical protein